MHQPIMSRIKQGGYSLIEILIGLTIGLFLLANGIMMYSAITKSYYEFLAINRLDHQLSSAMYLMTQEIRRAGYSASAVSSLRTGTNTNAFMVTANDISVPSSSCILFTYDSDSTGILPPLNTAGYDKRFGFRISGTTLQSRALTDSLFSCTSGAWENLTDDNLVNVSAATFTLTPTVVAIDATHSLTIRNVTISITGSLVSDPSVTRTITGTVRVRNDKYQ